MNSERTLPLVTLLLTFLLVSFCNSLQAADAKYQVAFYDRWTDMSTRQLTDKARHYMNMPNMEDSALVCYSIVANRYYEGALNNEDLKLCVNAMANLGFLYSSHYYEYQKAYSYLKQALDIAEKEKYSRLLSYIYLNLGVLSGTYEELNEQGTYSNETIACLDKAYRLSVANREWRAALYCLSDIIEMKFENNGDMTQQISQFSKFKATSEPLYRYMAYMCKGMEAWQKHNYAAAYDNFGMMLNNIPSSEEQNKYTLKLKAMRYQASALDVMGHDDEANAMLEDIARQANAAKAINIEVWIYKVIAEYLYGKGDKQQADAWRLKYYQTKERLQALGRSEGMEQLKFLYQLKRVDDEVKALSVKRKQQQLVFIISTVALLSVIIALLVSLRYYHRQRNFIQKLYDKNVALLKLNEKRLAAEPVAQEASVADTNSKYASSVLDETTKQEIFIRISKVMDDVETICSADFSIKQLSDKIKSNTTYVSQVINEKYNMNFKSLLNERRVAEACRMLSDKITYGNLTIEGIALSVGFKSRANFALVFKKITGLSATEFQRAALRDKG